MIPPVDSATRLIALLGDPVSHSLSPTIQNAAFAAASVPGVYLALRTDAAALPHMLRGIALAGGGGNVTVPHKAAAAAALDRPEPAVLRTGACNTFWSRNGEVCGDNTDVQGFRAAVATLLPPGVAGARVLLVGAGGAARAVLAALEDEGAAEVTIVNRGRDRAAALIDRFSRGPLSLAYAAEGSLGGERYDLAINATSLGLLSDDPLPVPPATATIGAALDLVYATGGTAWTRSLRDQGVPAADGTEMLVHQAAAAFRHWWGRPAPIQAMRDALPPTPL